tara:strand:+ start:103 stop:594 length:492 start_codon:yes stop_codon:yes gene_type:complete
MPRIDFAQLPADSRVWIFSADRVLSNDQQTQLLASVDGFLAQWGAHDMPLTAGREIRYDRFLFIAVDQQRVGPSGCSVDALVRQMKTLQQELGVELVDHAPVLFRRGDEIARVAREEFLALVADGEVSLDTTVFDNTLTRLGDVRDGRWETNAARTWHGRAFF